MATKKASKSWNERCCDLIREHYSKGPNFGIKEEWLAGLISVENASLSVPAAQRYEKGVFKSVWWVKLGHRSQSFPGFNSGPIKKFIEQNDDEKVLKMLATSYGLTQIMGYHYLNKWGITPQSLPHISVEQQVRCSLEMMAEGLRWAMTNKTHSEEDNFKELCRWWNTGSINGRPHHGAKYTDSAYKAMLSYRKFLEGLKND